MPEKKEEGISPAALGALLRGDFENAMVAMTPGGIEAQEARGQKDFVANNTLPIKCNYCSREQLEQMGIIFGDQVDDLFVAVQLPKGWKKVATDHSMGSKLVDEKGRERASIFHKAAFYDRSAHLSLSRRFSCRVEPIYGYGDKNYRQHEWHCVVADCGKLVWQSQRIEPEPEYSLKDEGKQVAWADWDKKREALQHTGIAWLTQNYPDWEDPLAYWD